MSKSLPKVYKTKITPKVIGLCLPPALSALFLGYYALSIAGKFGSADPTRFFFIGLPLLLSAVLIISCILLVSKYLRQSVTIEGESLRYQGPKMELSLEMAKMAYSPPAASGFFRYLMLSDGEEFIQLPELFMESREFEELNKTIRKLRQKSRQSGQTTYSL